MREILPLGSVVTLRQAQKRLMVIGRLQRDSQSERIFEYCGVLWPEGLISSDKVYLFDGSDVELVWFIGLQEEEEFQFRDFLDEKYEELGLFEKPVIN